MITPTLVEPTKNHEAGVASGVWSLQDQLEARRGGVWPEAGVADPDTIIEGNFSIDLFTGTGSTQDITNGIDLLNKGGLVWGKPRARSSGDFYSRHFLYDTERGTGTSAYLHSDQTDVQGATGAVAPGMVFNNNGFTTPGPLNNNNETAVTWTFKKAPKFFDVVTYEGTGSARTVAHSLGGTVGMILIKNLDQADNWAVYHRGADGSAPEDKYLILNTTAAVADSAAWWNDTAPTTSVFTVGTDHAVNADGENYVAYIFAHETGDDSMIQCGSYTHPNDLSTVSVDLGWEPQWILFKANQSKNWFIFDTMRGIVTDSNSDNLSGSNDAALFPNTTGAENANTWGIDVTATGFNSTGNNIGSGGNTVIYMAIRRPDMKTITDATEVFAVGTRGAVATADRADGFFAGFPIDLAIDKVMDSNPDHFITWRKAHLDLLARANDDSVFPTGETEEAFDSNTHFNTSSSVDTDHLGYMFKRAKGFCDVQMYRGTGSAKTEAHRLQVAPELMIIKNGETDNTDWAVYYGDNTDYLILNTTAATADNANWWNDTSPTSSVFTVGTATETNASGKLHLALLFATLAGVSKVGSVTHSGSSTDVDCGFSAGARFVLIKRTDATGNWYVFDTTNGIVAGNDPHWTLDLRGTSTTDADLIDPLAAGFTLTGDFTDGDYIFLAIA